jgi:hypothetical protein
MRILDDRASSSAKKFRASALPGRLIAAAAKMNITDKSFIDLSSCMEIDSQKSF